MSKTDLAVARATRDQMQRALRACAVDLEQVNRQLDEALESLRKRQARVVQPAELGLSGCTL